MFLIIPQINPCRYNFYKRLGTMFFLCCKSNPENPLSNGTQPAPTTMISLGHDTHKMAVLQDIDRDIKNILILSKLRSTIALAKHGKNLQAVEKEGHDTTTKNIGTGQENYILRTGKEHNQGIHQSILVIGRKDHRLTPGNVLLSLNLHLPIIMIKYTFHIGLDHIE